jgi:sulfite exporter TauE/SafE
MSMCGPLVMMLGRHRFRYFYFLGRLLSYSLAGMAAGGAGAVVYSILHRYNLAALASFIFGGALLYIGVKTLSNKPINASFKFLSGFNQTISLLLLKDQPFATFLFGFFTVALPCGQTLLVFSACALAGNAWVGLFNGFAFALLTSPSLFFAMQAHALFRNAKHHYNTIIGVSGLVIGLIAVCRGLADLELIPHLILNAKYHIVIF